MNIFSLLAVKKTELETGIVQSQTKAGVVVKVGSHNVILRATTSESLPTGSRVVIGDAGGKRYIIGRENLNSSRIMEVNING